MLFIVEVSQESEEALFYFALVNRTGLVLDISGRGDIAEESCVVRISDDIREMTPIPLSSSIIYTLKVSMDLKEQQTG